MGQLHTGLMLGQRRNAESGQKQTGSSFTGDPANKFPSDYSLQWATHQFFQTVQVRRR